MIRLNEHALLMCYPDGRVEPLDLSQLVCEIAGQNQSLASKLEPWMVEHVVQSIVHYIRNEMKKETVTLQDFIDLSRELLAHFSTSGAKPKSTAEAVCDLYQLAQRAGTGFELRFYDILRDHIQKASTNGSDSYVFTGLRRCVKFLAGHQRWRNRCRVINDEIVEFIRETLGRAATEDVRLSVS
jgi:hypothetical protein